MKKNNKKLKYGLFTLFYLVLFGFYIFFLINDLLKHNTGSFIKDLILAVIILLMMLGSYWEMKDVGTFNEDDERDDFVQMKTESQMFKILDQILFWCGSALLAWGLILGKHGVDTLVIVIISVAISLLILWNLMILIELILIGINYYRN